MIKLFLVKTSVPGSRYPAIAATFAVEGIFDLTIAVPVLLFAFTQGVFPKPPDFSQLDAFDLSYFASHPQFTLFVITGLAVLVLALFAWLSRRVVAFWLNVRQGLTVLFDRRRYLREVWLVQFAGWLLRFTAFWLLLDAFGVGGSVRNVLLVLGVNAVAALVPFTPGGAGVQQALLVKVFAGAATGATVAAYSVGQQIAIASVSLAVGFGALFFVFGFRSFRDVADGGPRASRSGETGRRGADLAAQRRPWRASRTSVTASGKTVAIVARICSACSAVVPCTLIRLIAATVMSTASLIALSAQASDCWLESCSANSAMRFCSSSGSPNMSPKPPMPSMLQSYSCPRSRPARALTWRTRSTAPAQRCCSFTGSRAIA